MKNQYFGDIYDYIKYGLLRRLSLHGEISTSVCWMLTENDDRRDGHRTNYLQEPAGWRDFDPIVFDCLRTAVLVQKQRNVGVVEKSGLLPDTTFYSRFLTEASDERGAYFDGFLKFADGRELVFFDPDNGLEIKSVKYGRRGASRYLFLHEVSQSFKAGHSLLLYQHLPPKPRDPFIRGLASRLIHETGSESVYVFCTPRVAFILVAQTDRLNQLDEVVSETRTNWGSLLDIKRYPY